MKWTLNVYSRHGIFCSGSPPKQTSLLLPDFTRVSWHICRVAPNCLGSGYLAPTICLYFFGLFRWNLSLGLIDLKWSGPCVTAPRTVLHTKWTLCLVHGGQVIGPSLCASTAVLLNTQSKHLDYRGAWNYFRANSPFYHLCCYIPQPFCLKSQNPGVIVSGSNVSKVIISQALSSSEMGTSEKKSPCFCNQMSLLKCFFLS